MKQEKIDLERFRDLAKAIFTNSKGDALLIALEKGFVMTRELGAKKKAIIFTESTITQNISQKHSYLTMDTKIRSSYLTDQTTIQNQKKFIRIGLQK